MGKFEVKTRKNGEFQFNLKAGNGQVILNSEGYTTKANCLNGIESVKKNAQDDNKFDRKTSRMASITSISKPPTARLLELVRCMKAQVAWRMA